MVDYGIHAIVVGTFTLHSKIGSVCSRPTVVTTDFKVLTFSTVCLSAVGSSMTCLKISVASEVTPWKLKFCVSFSMSLVPPSSANSAANWCSRVSLRVRRITAWRVSGSTGLPIRPTVDLRVKKSLEVRIKLSCNKLHFE